ncbi:calcium-independent phospholipase A2-gamma-like isoform X2 [Myxocyprinus asiaticus]|uniref:calcium-independent phospholipase A2-gamma-like isoform X2 n=1 Tax=Myxocyprinus asiaticus TaxID=70543 RepID=UPI002221D95B|nr:calcium-independent phospholipase A2-gamma-like isoform X2 [Myxocyprinus asiaticus]
MTVAWRLDCCVLHLWHRPGWASATFSISPLRNPFSSCRERLTWRHSQGRRFCFCKVGSLGYRVGLYTNISNFSTSTCHGSTDLRYRMSRLRSTLDSVSKVVSETQTEIMSRITRFKSGSGQEGKTKETGPETTASASSPSTTPAITPPADLTQTTAPAKNEQKVINKITGTAQTKTVAPPTNTLIAKQTTPLFHPGSVSVQLGKTYNYLSHHINSYFGSLLKTEETKSNVKDVVPSASTRQQETGHMTLLPVKEQRATSVEPLTAFSPSKGLGNYFSSSAPSVQALVGSYIASLVPRFKTEPKSIPVKADTRSPDVDTAVKPKEAPEKDQRAAEEKARRLLIQREKIIARVSVDNRTRALVQSLQRASDVKLYISRVEELILHLLEFPETRSVAVKEKVIPCLLRLRQASDPCLKAAVREALALAGYIEPVKNRGIRILSIDGGGTRGLLALQTLHRLEELSGKPIYQLFDYICGVSTGAILGFMLGVFHFPLKECEDLYRKLSSDVFKQNVIVGTVKMSWSHAFYDSEIWEKVLKEKMGSDLLIETSRDPDCPKVSAVSTVVNRGPPVKAYVFRNYNLPAGVRSHYRGDCRHKMWEAIRASSAAPGYFQEFALGNDLHQWCTRCWTLCSHPTRTSVLTRT